MRSTETGCGSAQAASRWNRMPTQRSTTERRRRGPIELGLRTAQRRPSRLAESGDQNRLDGVQPVLSLIEDHACPLEDLVDDLELACHAGLLHSLPPHRLVDLVEGGTTVHEMTPR